MKKNTRAYYIGIMSGTSMDAIDSALVSFENNKTNLLATTSTPIPAHLKTTLLALCQSTECDIRTLGETDTQIGILFAENCLKLLTKSGFCANDIVAIGSHGQTIYHHPNHAYPFTLQIGDPNIIAARTHITTVADFRRRDMALGGQGAPLVPAFHAYLFGNKNADQWAVNIGGMANITYLPSDEKKSIIGFDTGPGNTLLDQWHEIHQKQPYDHEGQWGRSGKIDAELLAHLLDDPYFKKLPPKSTGREYFNLKWLNEKLSVFKKKFAPADIQATLTELTAKTIADAIEHIHTPNPTLWVCGGGAYNHYLMERLRANLHDFKVVSTTEAGIDPQWIEAAAFAWLAKQTIEKKPGNCSSVTGASRNTILGGIYVI